MECDVEETLQKKGVFTVVELIVVISVIVVLGAIIALFISGQVAKTRKVTADKNAIEIANVTASLIEKAESAGTIKEENNSTLADKKTPIKLSNVNDDEMVKKVRQETGIIDGEISIHLDKTFEDGQLSFIVKQVYYTSPDGKTVGNLLWNRVMNNVLFI